MNETSYSSLFAPWWELAKSPATLLLVALVMIIALLLDVWPKFPSYLVPWVGMLFGAMLYPHLQRIERVPPDFPNPLLVLVLAGLLFAFLAVLFHLVAFKMLLKKFWPAGMPLPAFLVNTIQPDKENERNHDQS